MKRTLLTLAWEGYCRLWNGTMLVFANTSTCDLSKGDGSATLLYMIRYKNRVHLWAFQKRQSSGAFSIHWNSATKCVVVLCDCHAQRFLTQSVTEYLRDDFTVARSKLKHTNQKLILFTAARKMAKQDMAWLAAQKEGQENVVKISLRTKWICFAKTRNMCDNHGNFCLHDVITWLSSTVIKRMQQCYRKAMISVQIWTDVPIKNKTKWINRKYRFKTKGDFYVVQYFMPTRMKES